MQFFEKLPQILGFCPIVKFRSTLEKADPQTSGGPPPSPKKSCINYNHLHLKIDFLTISSVIFQNKVCPFPVRWPAATAATLITNIFGFELSREIWHDLHLFDSFSSTFLLKVCFILLSFLFDETCTWIRIYKAKFMREI